jgi:uncharacterized protein
MKALLIALALNSAVCAAAPPVARIDPGILKAQRAVQQGRVDLAISALQPLALRGHFGAQLSLAQLYELPGSTRDLTRALHWYTQAAGQGAPEAMEAVGLAFYMGRGVPADAAQAADWFRQAGDRGAVAAQYILGTMYEKGEGVPQDLRLARAWFDRAANQGDVAAAAKRDALDQMTPTTPPTRSPTTSPTTLL